MPSPTTVSEEESTRQLIREAITLAQEKKAEDLLLLALKEVTTFTDYFLIMSAQSEKQAQAISDIIVKELKIKHKIKPLHQEGQTTAQWILLDYVDFIIHIFQPEKREFYALERLWGDAPDVTQEILS